MIYRKLTASEYDQALTLAWKVFLQYEAPEYSKEGIDAFYQSIHDERYLSQLEVYGAFSEEEIVGVMATRNEGSHVALFFVEEKYQKRGIGKELFRLVWEYNTTGTMTVNSSPYAVPVYHRLGFVDTDSEQVTDGLRYTPMIFKE